ncbi:MAG TPA: M10 family metallopeptidase C-terminal domain-containing protein [Allosphingosinicella sp.]|nr:M10 family metallopeptidase C-terminal domain-containing protein [Allosphingosinicella sp.]
MSGVGGDDQLFGGDGEDILSGGAGVDMLAGAAGADLFRFGAGDSVASSTDLIADFLSGTDRIDLSQIDADLGTAGRQVFTFIGTEAFSATAGELRLRP